MCTIRIWYKNMIQNIQNINISMSKFSQNPFNQPSVLEYKKIYSIINFYFSSILWSNKLSLIFDRNIWYLQTIFIYVFNKLPWYSLVQNLAIFWNKQAQQQSDHPYRKHIREGWGGMEGKRTLLSDFSSAVLRNKSFEMRIVNGYILYFPIYIYEIIFSILKKKTITRTYWIWPINRLSGRENLIHLYW